MTTLRPRFLSLLVGILLLGGATGACEAPEPSPPNTRPPPSHLDSLAAAKPTPLRAGTPPTLVRSQTLYVPAYSHIYIRDATRSMNLATTLSLRNASPEESIKLSAIEYHDSSGDRVRSYLDTSRVLDPLASTYVVVEVGDIRGGVGANFLVRWHAETPVYPPIAETVMITTEPTQGISFRSPARVLREDRVPAPEVSPDSLTLPDARP
ncbi:MAG: hypothetical protein BRD43_06635 [Bacteroidetes bacterium QS_4_64_154]|nr:MAG: hypothetical protein BRD43_06635 [Bacteroidetes bacterium QS_4_64_154]